MVARSVAPSEFGLFALIFAAYVLLLGTSRSLSTDPLIVRFGASEWAQLRGRAVLALGTALGFGTICALAGGLIIFMLDVVLGMSFHGAPFYLLAASLPGLLLEDALRYVFFARRAPRSALVVDASAAVALALAFLWIALGNTRSLSWFVAAWGVSGLVSAAVGLRLGRLWPRIGGMRRWLAAQRDLSSRYLGEFIALSGSQLLVLYFLAFVTSLPEVAALRGGQMLMTPVMVLFAGVGPIAVPELIHVRARSRRSFER
ncbi:MAG: hypothetical protein M3292_12220, partial [Actinomycetota bacterium]|nr:hypothetical protein [Actinomycetota bacterium]